MQEFKFKKTIIDGLISFLQVVHTPVVENISNPASQEILYRQRLHNDIALAQFLTEDLDRFILLRKSEGLSTLQFLRPLVSSEWKYLILFNDQQGLGTDHGFCSTEILKENQNLLLALNSLLDLCTIPDDIFGDSHSTITVFGLRKDRAEALERFLLSKNRPKLEKFLLKEEVFVHLKLSKRKWGQDCLLIKSRKDIESSLIAFQTIINPNN